MVKLQLLSSIFSCHIFLSQVHINSLSVCLIDDCINRDVPLLDFSLSNFLAEHMLREEKRGRAKGNFAGDYYNRNISAWEPIIEPWK